MRSTLEQRREACIQAPLGRSLVRPDTEIIERPGWYQIVTPSAVDGFLNEIAISQVEPEDAERCIDEVLARYRELGGRTKWCVGPWTRPHDFGARLAARGFSSWDVLGMGASTDRTPASATRVNVRVVTEDTLDEYIATELRGWSLSAEHAAMQRTVYLRAMGEQPRHAYFFAAEFDRQIVATAGLVLRGEVGYLLAAQVLEAARGRGAYRALVEARLAFLHERGIGYAVTHARTTTSAPILAHLGFETLFESQCYLLP